jgi:phage-related protein
MGKVQKPIMWIGSARDDIRGFPRAVRRKAGVELQALQRGEQPSDFKPMASIGPGVYEIRIKVQGAYRVLYIAKYEEAVYVLHAFHKKTQKTAKPDVEIGRQRYKIAQQRHEAKA